MNLISVERYIKNKLILLLLLFTSLTTQAQVTLKIGEIIEQQGDEVKVSVTVYDFENILGMQFSIHWDPEILQFVAVDDFGLGGLAASLFGVPTSGTNPGNLTLSWVDAALQGETLIDGTILFSITYQCLSDDVGFVSFAGIPTPIEFTDGNEEAVEPILSPGIIKKNTIKGTIFWDENDNCSIDPEERGLQGWIVRMSGIDNYLSRTDENGQYGLPAEIGTYELNIFPPNDYWGFCDIPLEVTIDDLTDTLSLNIPAQTLIQCPLLVVDVSTTLLRRCFDNTYTIWYCNNGTAMAEDAFVEVNFDTSFQILGSNLPWGINDQDTYIFQLGDIEVGACGVFEVDVHLPCEEIVLGQTHCVSAQIFPDSLCTPTSPAWSGASIEVDAICEPGMDSVRFLIKNAGAGDMLESAKYIVVEDAVMYSPKPFSLNGGAVQEFSMAASGTTFRLEADQVFGHPIADHPSVSIEGCGAAATGDISLGFVNQFPLNDSSPSLSIDCRENVGSFDPNDKLAFPKGVLEPHYIQPNTDLEYIIRFQNTGTDIAFNVLIRDTLSTLLDITKIQLGASSHPYRIELVKENELLVYFDQIMLPDSNTNEPASHGFIKFRIPQLANNALGSIIENKAAIYFDFNDPVITQTSFHTIGENFLEIVPIPTVPELEVKIDIYPNPFREKAVFEIRGPLLNNSDFLLYRSDGQLLRKIQIKNNQWELPANELATGWYSYQILQNGQSIGRGKLIKN